MPTTTTISATTGSGLTRSPTPTVAWATKRLRMPMIMKTFHSSGTPIGRLLMMLRWKQIITTAATLVTIPPSPSSRSSGTPNSTTVPPWARAAEMRPGP